MPTWLDETTNLLTKRSNDTPNAHSEEKAVHPATLRRGCSQIALFGSVLMGLGAFLALRILIQSPKAPVDDFGIDLGLESSFSYAWEANSRCTYVLESMNANHQHCDKLRLYATNYNVFYRATASIFWIDYTQIPQHPSSKSTWTWVTGDQHLSNFGAWRNRNEQVVFSVNDFDEAAIYDFQVDILRLAVSICNHAVTNGLHKDLETILEAFTESYIEAVISFVHNQDAETYELTAHEAMGKLNDFMVDVEADNSHDHLMDRFTSLHNSSDSRSRRFIHTNDTRLLPLSDHKTKRIREAFSSTRYRATMLKTGWHVHEWDDDYFEVLDVAARVGSGVGSYGVDRYYVLLHGNSDKPDGAAFVLDIKYEPEPAVSKVLSADDQAWYDVMFQNEAARAVKAQRRLTSYTDPFTGWVILDGKAFVVRQRSPWKASPDIASLTNIEEFLKFIQQIGLVTATSHVRGSVAKAPGEFKQVIAKSLGKWKKRKAWTTKISTLAMGYHDQVVMDYKCFHDFVENESGC